jgi:hypothetical protein
MRFPVLEAVALMIFEAMTARPRLSAVALPLSAWKNLMQ